MSVLSKRRVRLVDTGSSPDRWYVIDLDSNERIPLLRVVSYERVTGQYPGQAIIVYAHEVDGQRVEPVVVEQLIVDNVEAMMMPVAFRGGELIDLPPVTKHSVDELLLTLASAWSPLLENVRMDEAVGSVRDFLDHYRVPREDF